MSPRLRHTIRALLSIGILLCLIVVLHGLGRFGLRGPEGADVESVRRWLEDPVVVVATIIRWLALACCYYLLLVALALTVQPDRTARGPMSRLVPLRVIGLFALAVGTAGVTGAALAPHEASTNPAPDIEPRPSLARAEDPLVLRRSPDDGRSPHPQHEPSRTTTDATDRNTTNTSTGVDRNSLWVVEPGDHLWSIASDTLEESWGRSTLSDAEIVGYWRVLIEANRDRLVEPDNPDLILPGQEFVLPPVPRDSLRE